MYCIIEFTIINLAYNVNKINHFLSYKSICKPIARILQGAIQYFSKSKFNQKLDFSTCSHTKFSEGEGNFDKFHWNLQEYFYYYFDYIQLD